jgi:hypothetical protein
MVFFNEPELNSDELQCAIRDAAMIVARLSLTPDDGYIGSQEILSMIRPPSLATRSVRPEDITISGINFALSNHYIRKTLQKFYSLKFENTKHLKDQFTHQRKQYYVHKIGVDISNRYLPGVRTLAEAAFVTEVEETISKALLQSNTKKGNRITSSALSSASGGAGIAYVKPKQNIGISAPRSKIE